MNTIALGIIDAQRGFMPAEEGARLGRDGFGELAVPDGEQIVEPVNLLLAAFAARHLPTFTTQDWHPYETAHFSDNPNFTTTWPMHCVDGTPGAELHPEIKAPASTVRFLKGMQPLQHGEDDTSYSAYYAEDPTTGITLPNHLRDYKVNHVYLAGLALEVCVGLSGVDLREKDGLDVTLITDASRGLTAESTQKMLERCAGIGIATITTRELLDQIYAEQEA